MHAQQRLVCRTAAIAFAVIVWGSSIAKASLMFDLRAREVSGPNLIKNNDKSVWVYGPGGKVIFDVWATIQGADANLTNDRLQLYSFRVKSSGPGLRGDMFNINDPINDPPTLGPTNGWETGAGASPGTLQDLDGDGDKDIGAVDAIFANGTDGNANGRNLAPPAYSGSGSVAQFHVYSFEWNVGSFGGGITEIVVERSPVGTAFLWRQDGTTFNKNGLNDTVGVLPGVSLFFIPEPRAIVLALFGLAGVALALRSRRASK